MNYFLIFLFVTLSSPLAFSADHCSRKVQEDLIFYIEWRPDIISISWRSFGAESREDAKSNILRSKLLDKSERKLAREALKSPGAIFYRVVTNTYRFWYEHTIIVDGKTCETLLNVMHTAHIRPSPALR